MNSLVKEAYEKTEMLQNEELEMLDKKVCKWATNMFTAFFAGVDGDEKRLS